MQRPFLLAACGIAALAAYPAFAQDAHAGHSPAPAPILPAPTPARPAGQAVPPPPAPQADPHAGHTMPGTATPQADPHAGHRAPAPTEAGHYMGPSRYFSGCTSTAIVAADSNIDGTVCQPCEGSGTARIAANDGAHSGLHRAIGDGWMLMLHGFASAQATSGSGPRGGDLAYVTSMAMATASRETGWGRIQLRAMTSLEPLLPARGYPVLFASGETANGRPLVDRQHPHDLFMELAARVDVNVGAGRVFLYGGPVGEPAIGPAAFMHRPSARLNPEPPITHHWFDSTHITYCVVTAGYADRYWQIEASAFRGREPDEERWGIETPRLDSWAVRATWNPAPAWALQVSTARLRSPEGGHDGESEQRTTASISFASGTGVSAMIAFAAKDRLPGPTLTAWLAEAQWNIGERHALFGRIENVANDELFPDAGDPLHERTFRVTKFEAGYAYRIPLGDFSLALGGAASAYAKPAALDVAYGRAPVQGTLFARLSLGH